MKRNTIVSYIGHNYHTLSGACGSCRRLAVRLNSRRLHFRFLGFHKGTMLLICFSGNGVSWRQESVHVFVLVPAVG